MLLPLQCCFTLTRAGHTDSSLPPQNLWDTDAACAELEIVHASYRERLKGAFKTEHNSFVLPEVI